MFDEVTRSAWCDRLHEILPRLFRYDPETGRLYHRERTEDMFAGSANPARECKRFNTRHAGREAMTGNSHGYLHGRCFGREFLAHRIAFTLIHGRWPTLEIDHIDGNPLNNRPENLREVTHVENKRNCKRPKNNTSGVVGVFFLKRLKLWRARITLNGKKIDLGDFRTFEKAVEVRAVANVKYGFHPNHGRAA